MPDSNSPRPRLVGFVLVVLVALILRLIGLGSHGLWADEFVGACNALGWIPWSPLGDHTGAFFPADLWRLQDWAHVRAAVISDGGNGLAFYAALHPWVQMLGTGEFALRLLPALAGSLTVGVLWLMVSDLIGTGPAHVAAGLAAVNPLLLRYSQEARPYAFALLFATVASDAFARLILMPHTARPTRLTARYAVATAAALMSHYMTVGLFVGHAVYALGWCRNRQIWRQLLVATVLPVLLIGAWWHLGGREGYTVMARLTRDYHQETLKFRRGGDGTAPATLHYLGVGNARSLLQMSGNYLESLHLSLPMLLPWFLVPGGLLMVARRRWPVEARRGCGPLLVCLSGGSLAFGTALSLHHGHTVPLHVNYHVFCTPYLLALLAVGVHVDIGRPGRLSWQRAALTLPLGVITAVSASLVYGDAPRYRASAPLAPLVALLQRLPGGDTVVVYPSWKLATYTNLYLAPDLPLRQVVQPSPGSNRLRILRDGYPEVSLALPAHVVE